MRPLLAALLLAACGDNLAPIEPDAETEGPDAFEGIGVSCSADVRLTCAVGCAVTVTVAYQCDAAEQVNRWTRIGVETAPATEIPFWETEYRCGETLPTMVADVPCDAEIVIAGAVADHPTGGDDFDCLVGPIAACE